MKMLRPLMLLTAIIGLLLAGRGSVAARQSPATSVDALIVGGEPASPGEFPWMAAIVDEDGAFCGGALIDREWVLTAAHCFFSEPEYDDEIATQEYFPGDFQIVLGAVDVTDGSGQTLEVTAIIEPGFNGGDTKDIALLKLARPANIDGEAIATISFNTDKSFPPFKTVSTVAGWGAMRTNGPASDILRKVSVPVVACDSEDSPVEFICAGGVSRKDTCYGDSGGPLFVSRADSKESIAVGITSFGQERCGRVSDYTRISTYATWIEDTLREKVAN
jgi:secreted trypsin-like serine protease